MTKIDPRRNRFETSSTNKDYLSQADALMEVGDRCFFELFEIDNALARYQEALDLYRSIGAKLGEAKATASIGNLLNYRDEWDAALSNYTHALQLYREIGEHHGEANVLKAIGDVQSFHDERDAALDSYQQALALFRPLATVLARPMCFKPLAMCRTSAVRATRPWRVTRRR